MNGHSTRKPLHIGYLVQDFPPEVGAGPARVTEMARRWQELGARVTVITGMPNRRIPGRGEGVIDPAYQGRMFLEESWEGIRTLRSWVFASASSGFGAKMVNNASFMLSGFAHAAARAGKPDVLIASSPPFLPHVSGVALAGLWRIPLVLEIRDLWPDYLVQMGVLGEGLSKKLLFGLERWLLSRADHVVVVTDSFRERVVAKGVPRESITVIPNGVDLELYKPGTPPTAPSEEVARATPVNSFKVGYIGTFGRGQDLSQVVKAAAILEGQDPDIRICLVGDGPDRPAVVRALESFGVKNVSLVPPIPRAHTPGFYNWCDVCLVPLAAIPIFQETIPSKIFEVMASSRPVIAAVKGEGGAIVENSGAGLRVDPAEPEQLALAIRSMKQLSTADRETFGRNGRDYVGRNYNRRDLADRYLKLLSSVSGRPAS